MIGYITVGTNDFSRAATFYDELLAELNAKRVMETPAFIFPYDRLKPPSLDGDFDFNVLTYARLRGA